MTAENAIALMTEKEKETVLVSFMLGGPVEAARHMGEPWPTVKNRLCTMRQRLGVLMRGEACQ
jgi:DNA-directed RNA polymerase specialized sigma24 family protein